MSITLEELLVELRAETAEYKAAIENAVKVTEKGFDKIVDELKTVGQESKKTDSIARQAFGTMAGFIGGQAVIGAFNAAAGAAIDLAKALIVDGVKAAMEEEKAIAALSQQMKLVGDFTDGARDDMLAYAESIAAVSTADSGAILSQLALAKTFGRTNEETKELVTAALELSSATGKDLDTAVQSLGKSYSGTATDLAKLLPGVKDLTEEQLRQGKAVDLVMSRFGGSAKAQLDTFSGSVEHLENTWGDVGKAIGTAIVQSDGIKGSIQDLDKWLITIIPHIQSATDSLVRFLGFDERFEEKEKLFDAIEELEDKIGNLNFRMQETPNLASVLEPQMDAAVVQLERLREEYDLVLEKSVQTNRKMKDETIDSFSKQGQSLQIYTDKQRESAEQGRKLAEDLLINMTDENSAREEILQDRHDREQEMLDEAHSLGEISLNEYLGATSALSDKHAADEMAREQKIAQFKAQMRAQELTAASSLFGGLAAISALGGKKLFTFTKRMRQLEAITSTAAAVTNALAVPPYPVGVALAIGAGLKGAAQVALIERQNLATGIESVPGIGDQDNFPAMLKPGESVINPKTNEDLISFLERNKRLERDGDRRGSVNGVIRILVEPREAAKFIRAEFISQNFNTLSPEGVL